MQDYDDIQCEDFYGDLDFDPEQDLRDLYESDEDEQWFDPTLDDEYDFMGEDPEAGMEYYQNTRTGEVTPVRMSS